MKSALLDFAASQQQRHDTQTTADERKQKGHFGTPLEIAQFMAGMFPNIPRDRISLIDPGAGVGTLTAAFCQRVAKLKAPRQVSVELWENDASLHGHLRETMHECQRVLTANGHNFGFTIQAGDFILSHSQRNLFHQRTEAQADFVIMNPPYFKLRKDSPQARAMSHVVHGQPNIYALFMALSADLLKTHGHMVAITPRSYFNGPYFKRFRKWLLDRLSPHHIHIFESRKDAFRNDAVLQENVILCAQKTTKRANVKLTSSKGHNLSQASILEVPFSRVVDERGGDSIIRVTTCPDEQELIAAVDTFPHRLRDLGLEISTGPVVTFRATEHLLYDQTPDSAPLLWMRNVRPFLTHFPPINGKPTHIRVSDTSKSILLQAKRYVLLKRFTAKEEKRRLVAGIVQPTDSYSPFIGLENHLNYIHKIGGELTGYEALGLAAILNSSLVDRYFRAISGNTQVNAAEIRNLPLPSLETIADLGKQLGTDTPDADVDRLVGGILGV